MTGRRTGGSAQTHSQSARQGYSIVSVLAVLCILMILVALFLPSGRRAREASRRSQCRNNLKQIAIGLHNYEETYGALPPAFTVDDEGRRLHSWRTLILPYIDQLKLYETIDLSRPWDDPANAAARKTAIDVFDCPSGERDSNETTYMALVGPDACFAGSKPRAFPEFHDGLSNTLMVVEVSRDQAVHWMAPHDTGRQFLRSLASDSQTDHTGGFQAALGDGTVRFINLNVPAETRNALITVAGGEEPGEW